MLERSLLFAASGAGDAPLAGVALALAASDFVADDCTESIEF